MYNLKFTKHCPTDKIELERSCNLTEETYRLIIKLKGTYKNCKFTAYCEIRENVVIGDNTTMGSRCTISANATIGSNTTIKYGFVLTDTPDLKEGDKKVVKGVGNNVLIGANVTLMPGFSIGNNSIIGACSQVRAHVGENEFWYGSPAKFYKDNE